MMFGKSTIRSFLLFASVIVSAKSSNEIECGSTVSSDTFLTKDLDCDCSLAPALNVNNGAKLVLGLNKVSCSNSFPINNPCIVIQGSSTTVEGGTVERCIVGISVGGDGKHTIKNVKVMNTIGGILVPAISVASNKNIIEGNFVSPIASIGIGVTGNDNVIVSNKVTKTIRDGIVVSDGASRNKILSNEISEMQFGIFIARDATDTLVKWNKVENTSDCGIEVSESINGVISHNTVKNAGFFCVTVAEGSGNQVLLNDCSHAANGLSVESGAIDTVVEANNIKNIRFRAIDAFQIANGITKINKNRITNAGADTSAANAIFSGIIDLRAVSNVEITRNIILDSGANGIFIDSGTDSDGCNVVSTDIKIVSNVIQNGVGWGIFVDSRSERISIGRNLIRGFTLGRIERNR